MKSVEVSRRSKSLLALLRDAQEEDIILRSPDGHEFLLAELDDFDREIEITRKNKKLKKFLQERARQPATLSFAEVRKQLGL
ncbi:MAG: hypothetical protein HYV26_13020 [Candidatus Hydrogenedentes bacterium]|nr:hypothetical protein [Candidatus Hydrogenedentota bacterium]